MILHYLKLAYRNFRLNKLIFFGSIITLFLGVTCTVLLLVFIRNELTMNGFHKEAKNIYLVQMQLMPDSKPEAVSPTLSEVNFIPEEYPEIAHLVTIQNHDLKFTVNDASFWERGFVASNNFFDVFDFDLLTGNKQTALLKRDNILITERLSAKLFGDKNPIGERVIINSLQGDNKYEHTVVGILKNPPSNSSMDFDFVIPQDTKRYFLSGVDFLVLNKNFNKTDFENKIKNLMQRHNNDRFKESKLSVMPLDEVYFSDSPVESSWSYPIFTRYGNKKTVNIFLAIIVIILFMSALNFSNFQVINVNASLKNMGLIKMFGAGNRNVFSQKLCEIIIFSGITSVLVLLACFLVLPFFNKLVDTELNPGKIYIVVVSFAILFTLSTISIIYPMVVNARVPIAFGLKKTISQGKSISGRKTVVAIQFTMTFVLLIATLTAIKQLNMMLNKDVGFNTKNIITTNFISDNEIDREALKNNQQYIKNELARIPSISSFSQGNTLFDSYTKGGWKKFGDSNDFKAIMQLTILPESFQIFGLVLSEGRFFKGSEEDPYAVVINEAAKKYFGFDNIDNAKLIKEGFDPDHGGTLNIVGVVKDFNFEHLSKAPQPLIIQLGGAYDGSFIVEYKKGKEQESLASIKTIFDKLNPGKTFQYKFISDYIAAMYQKDKQQVKNYIIFSIIALLISTIGLFTIALYDTRRRIKEIGIRKVNGAKIGEVIGLLGKSFLTQVLIAFIVAIPIAYYVVYKWLESFAYKTAISWWVFLAAGIFGFMIAFFSVSWQSWRAATRNPVEALRYE